MRSPSSSSLPSSPSSAFSLALPLVPQGPFAVMAPPPPPRPRSRHFKLRAIATLSTTTCTPPSPLPTRCPIHPPPPSRTLTQAPPANIQQPEKPFSTLSSAPTSTIFRHPPNVTSSLSLQWSAAPPVPTRTLSIPGATPTAIIPTAQTPLSSGPPLDKLLEVQTQISG